MNNGKNEHMVKNRYFSLKKKEKKKLINNESFISEEQPDERNEKEEFLIFEGAIDVNRSQREEEKMIEKNEEAVIVEGENFK